MSLDVSSDARAVREQGDNAAITFEKLLELLTLPVAHALASTGEGDPHGLAASS